ncbi:phenylacetic acid degradation protein PaaY, partial [Escherichia coli]
QSIVAACAFVRAGMQIPPRTLVAGLPAKVVRDLTEGEMAWKRAGTETYHDLAKRSLKSLREVSPLAQIEENRPSLAAPFVEP